MKDEVCCATHGRDARATGEVVLPSSLTVFLSNDERRLAIRALKKLGPDRRSALLRALKIDGACCADRGRRRG